MMLPLYVYSILSYWMALCVPPSRSGQTLTKIIHTQARYTYSPYNKVFLAAMRRCCSSLTRHRHHRSASFDQSLQTRRAQLADVSSLKRRQRRRRRRRLSFLRVRGGLSKQKKRHHYNHRYYRIANIYSNTSVLYFAINHDPRSRALDSLAHCSHC